MLEQLGKEANQVMKKLSSIGVICLSLAILSFLFFSGITMSSRDVRYANREGHKHQEGLGKKEDAKVVYPAGSSLPDCSHACGPCSPCRRVMVSAKCSVAESCPVVYRCMCKGRYYHVPSNY